MFTFKFTNFAILFTLTVAIPSGICQNSGEYGQYLEGDILGYKPVPITRSGRIPGWYRWENATVPYVFQPFYPDRLKNLFKQAANYISSLTCIKFQPRTNETDFLYVTFGTSGDCASYVGKMGGNQSIFLPSKCRGMTMVHELIHALGFYHEQNRTDRDDYVKINVDNIKPGRELAFKKFGQYAVSSFGVDYDYDSVMHYSSYAFAKSYRIPTIESLKPGVRLGQRRRMSPGDVAKVNNMYC